MKYSIIRLTIMNGRGINGLGEIEFVVETDEIRHQLSMINNDTIDIEVIASSGILRSETSSLDSKGHYTIFKSQIGFIKHLDERDSNLVGDALKVVNDFMVAFARKRVPNGSLDPNTLYTKNVYCMNELKKKIETGNY